MIHLGDCVEVMRGMEADSVDAVVTDPPYGLGFMGKAWDNAAAIASRPPSADITDQRYRNVYPRTGKGPAAVAFDGHAFQAWCEAWGREALRVTKPGGYLLAFGGTRTHHRLVCGLEDAGWIIRDELTWVYASGFPKGKANLKPAHEPIVLARKPGPLQPLQIDATRIGYADAELDEEPLAPCEEVPHEPHWDELGSCPGYSKEAGREAEESAGKGWWPVTEAGPRGAPTPPSARRKGKVNFNAKQRQSADSAVYVGGAKPGDEIQMFKPGGRWPSNVLLSDPELFDEPNPYVVGSGATSDGMLEAVLRRGATTGRGIGYLSTSEGGDAMVGYGDSGGYSRFFIIPKADRADREPIVRGQLAAQERDGHFGQLHEGTSAAGNVTGRYLPRANSHPTVKPTDLMRHLVRLVTPSGGMVLDPFLGSGSTAIACELEGYPWVGIEKEPEYVAIAEARLNGTQRGLGLDTPLIGEPRKSVDGVAGKRSGQNGYDGGWGASEEVWGGYGPSKPPKVDLEREPGMFDEDLDDALRDSALASDPEMLMEDARLYSDQVADGDAA